jgi:carboxyl-terminal processing protease
MKMELAAENVCILRHMSRIASRFLALLSLIALFGFSFGQQGAPPTSPPGSLQTQTGPASMDAKAKQDLLDRLQDVVTKSVFVPGVDFGKWPTFLAEHRAEIDKADTDAVFARELNRVLKEFGVSHISLRTPRAATRRSSGKISGFGITVKKVDTGLQITNVFPQGPAGQVGIQTGDIIKEVEGKPADDPALIRVDLGKTLAMKVLMKSGETKAFSLENKEFSPRRPETLTWIADDAAVLRIATFANGYDLHNVESLIKEANAKARYLVIDLRSNGGGLVANLNHFLSMLMPDATPVGTFIGRTVADEYAKTHSEGLTDPIAIAGWAPRKFKTNRRDGVEPFTGKIAVLLNRGSASASEIAGAALKDCRDAIFVGTESLGAVLASVYRPLTGGWELQYPVQDYITIKGERLEGHPREPDLKIERTAEGPDDAPAKALELLQKKASGHPNAVVSAGGHGGR